MGRKKQNSSKPAAKPGVTETQALPLKEGEGETVIVGNLDSMILSEILGANPKLREQFEEAIKDAIEASAHEPADDSKSEEVEGLQEVVDAQLAEIKGLKEDIAKFKKDLEQKEVQLKSVKDTSVIMDAKKLDPEKTYVSGPNGLGFVEAK